MAAGRHRGLDFHASFVWRPLCTARATTGSSPLSSRPHVGPGSPPTSEMAPTAGPRFTAPTQPASSGWHWERPPPAACSTAPVKAPSRSRPSRSRSGNPRHPDRVADHRSGSRPSREPLPGHPLRNALAEQLVSHHEYANVAVTHADASQYANADRLPRPLRAARTLLGGTAPRA